MSEREPDAHRSGSRHGWGLKQAIPGLVLVVAGLALFIFARPAGQSGLEWEERSDYSHIRVRRDGNVRELYFVRDDGREIRQSRLNLEAPHELLSPYARAMFASYLYRPEQDRVLIVGLGGGAMVRFLQHHEPELCIDVVEIDPVVVKLADQYFGARTGGNVNIMTADGFQYLADTTHHYDVIYFDAFLKPSETTDATGVPSQLKTTAFYQGVQEKLRSGGVVVFNLNVHSDTEHDLRTIRDVFPETTVFSCPGSRNLVAVARLAGAAEPTVSLQDRARALDVRFHASFSFQDVLSNRTSR